MINLNKSNMASNSSFLVMEKVVYIVWKENGAVNFRFFFSTKIRFKKKMEESQKWKNMTSMCFFPQAKNPRKRILKFYKTDCQYSTESNKVYMIFRIHQVHFGIPVGIFEPVMEKGWVIPKKFWCLQIRKIFTLIKRDVAPRYCMTLNKYCDYIY